MDIITTHINAEFDSFASMVAARRLYPEALLVFPGAQERNLRFFLANYPHHYSFRRLRSLRLDEVKKLIIVDTRRSDRIGRLAGLLDNKDMDIHIYDHHPPSPNDIKGHREVIREVGATITIFVELFHKDGLKISPAEATIFALGLYEDTGSLSFTSTTPRDLRAAGHLLECGADLRVVTDYIGREMTPEQVSLLNDLLKSRKFIDVSGLKVAVATASRDRFVGDLAMIAHKMKDIENLNVLFLLVKMHDRIHMVARSRLEAIDAGEIAANLGGGGHPTAASAVIRHGDIRKVKEELVRILRQKVKPVHQARGLMSVAVKSLPVRSTISQAKEVISRFGIENLPILERGRLVGIIGRGAVEKALQHGLGDSAVSEFMGIEYETLSPDDPYYRIQELFLNFGQKFLPVVEKGRLIGVITPSDLLGVMRVEADLKPTYRSGTDGKKHFRPARNVAALLEERLPSKAVGLIRSLGEVANRAGVNAYLVGGIVRDIILNVPNLDLDLVVEGNGISFARKAARQLKGRVRSHKKFETAVIILPDGFKIDVATARMEYYEYPGALPKVEHGSIKMDLYRRDFTINALAVQLNGPDFGRLLDFFGGQRDLEEGYIRVLHDLSFVDDPTRVFRAVRFEQRLHFTIGEHTLRLIANADKRGLIENIAGPRLLGEIRVILEEEDPLPALRRLWELKLQKAVHPAFEKVSLDDGLIERLKKIFQQYRSRLDEEEVSKWLVYLAALTADIDDQKMALLYDRLAMAPDPCRRLTRIRAESAKLVEELSRRGVTAGEVHRLASAHSLEVIFYALAGRGKGIVTRRLKEHLKLRGKVKPYLSGDDLLNMGYRPGPQFRKMLDALMNAQLDGQVRDRRMARSWLKKNFPPERL